MQGSEFLHDLKTLTERQFVTKYLCTETGYAELLDQLNKGETIVPMPLAATKEQIEDSMTKLANHDLKKAGVKVKVTIPEKVQYAADALGDNVLVVRVEREHSSQLIIPESAKTKSDVGRVMAIGPDVKRCIKGDLVLFDKFASHGKEIDLVDDQGIPRQHLLLNDVDVQLKLTRFTSLPS